MTKKSKATPVVDEVVKPAAKPVVKAKTFDVVNVRGGDVSVCGVLLIAGAEHSFDMAALSDAQKKVLNNSIKCNLIAEA